MPRKALIDFRRGAATAWTLANPTLADGEPGWESDTKRLKIGDGSTAWASLPYYPASGATGLELLTGNSATFPSGSSANLTWDTKISGDDLLDLTDPANPVIVADGIYAVNVQVGVLSSMTVGGGYAIDLKLDIGGGGTIVPNSVTAMIANDTPTLGASSTYFIAAGGVIEVTLANYDGVLALDFFLGQANVQRIS